MSLPQVMVQRAVTEEEEHRAIGLLFAGEPEIGVEVLSEGPCASILAAWLCDPSGDASRFAGAALCLDGQDQSFSVWPPKVVEGLSEDVQAAVVGELLIRMDELLASREFLYSQAIIPVEEQSSGQLLERIGFERAAGLFFMGRSLTGIAVGASPDEGAKSDEWRDGVDIASFAGLIDRTGEGSLDLPVLAGIRAGSQTVKSHRSGRGFEPRWWHTWSLHNEPLGIVMMNRLPDGETAELVYLGVVAEHRGRGWGEWLLNTALERAHADGARWGVLAVDAANGYAIDLYERNGWSGLCRRDLWLRLNRSREQQ